MELKRVRLILTVLLLGTITASCGEQPTTSKVQTATKKVLLIGLDGIRVDILAQAHTSPSSPCRIAYPNQR